MPVRVTQCTVMTARVIQNFSMTVLLIQCRAVVVADSIFSEIICHESQYYKSCVTHGFNILANLGQRFNISVYK